jgi:outer membrane immunogenic protein
MITSFGGKIGQRVRRIGAALVWVALSSIGQGFAADWEVQSNQGGASLPVYRNAHPAATYEPRSYGFYDWSGFYLGLNGGWAFGSSSWNPAASAAPTSNFGVSGALLGGTAGYNWQTGYFLVGVEVDLDWAHINGGTPCGLLGVCESRSPWFGTARARVGYAMDRYLFYVTGGVAFGEVFSGLSPSVLNGMAGAGYGVGAGFEFPVYGPWTGKLEYLYFNLGNLNCSTACGWNSTSKVDFQSNVFRGGINYRF